MTASQKLGEKVYADMQAQQAAGAGGGRCAADAKPKTTMWWTPKSRKSKRANARNPLRAGASPAARQGSCASEHLNVANAAFLFATNGTACG
jgi:hypothetical protein